MARSLWVKMLVSNAEMGGAKELIMDVSLVHVHDLTGNAADPAFASPPTKGSSAATAVGAPENLPVVN